jgi:diaminopimelate decarboxylase
VSTQVALSHVYPHGTRVNARGHLELGGCDALELARRFGTPVYVVCEEDLRLRARSFVDAVAARHDEFEVLFASKAFPCTAVYRLLAEEGIGCDVASGGELATALAGGFEPSRIYLHGNAKSERELDEALAAGVGHVVVDSFDEIERLQALAEHRAVAQDVLVRVTPDVAGDTHAGISTGQANSKFGFSIDAAREAIRRLDACTALTVVGLHFHIGSQLFELEPFRAAVRAISDLGEFGVYDFGGGLAAAYLTAQRPPSADEYVAAIVDAAHSELGTGFKLLIEPGRALVANSTVTLYTIQTIKRNVSLWVAVDGGMSDNARPMMYGARYEAAIASRPLATGDVRCHLAGKHCESSDVIVTDALLPAPAVGDVVVTPVTGAYGYAMASNYNGVPRPPVVFVADGNAREVVRRERYEDLMARDVD